MCPQLGLVNSLLAHRRGARSGSQIPRCGAGRRAKGVVTVRNEVFGAFEKKARSIAMISNTQALRIFNMPLFTQENDGFGETSHICT